MSDRSPGWLPLSRVALRPGHDDFTRSVQLWQAAMLAAASQLVALYFQDSGDFACALFGAWHAGKTVVLPGDLQPATLDRLRAQGCHLASDVDQAVLPTIDRPAALDTAPTADLLPLDLHDTRLVIYTSGSSGEPCAIDKKLAQLDAEVQALQTCFGSRLAVPGQALRTFATVSHQHIYGLLFGVMWPLAAGRPVAATRLAYPEEIAQRAAEGPCVLVSSPAHLGRLPQHLDWHAAPRNLRAVFSSGGPLALEAAHRTQALLGPAPIEVYGSSETGGIAWRQRSVDADAAQAERWTPLPQVEVAESDGCLQARSPHLPDAAWWTTADRIADLHDDGSFTLLGRADRIVKLEEKRVSLTAIERCLTQSPWVADARVLPLKSAVRAELGAVIVLSESGQSAQAAQGKRAINETLRQHLLQVVERVALPRRWRYVRELPVNAQGKTTEALLMNLFDPAPPSRPLLPVANWLERGELKAQVELAIVPELAVLDGHFPIAAILPGVAQLDWAILYGREAFAMPPHFVRVDALKFQQPVRPGTALLLTLEWKADKSALHFAYTSQDGAHSSGRVVWASQPSGEAAHG